MSEILEFLCSLFQHPVDSRHFSFLYHQAVDSKHFTTVMEHILNFFLNLIEQFTSIDGGKKKKKDIFESTVFANPCLGAELVMTVDIFKCGVPLSLSCSLPADCDSTRRNWEFHVCFIRAPFPQVQSCQWYYKGWVYSH